jgi:molybdopterin-containing oxidoreductase family iron-sulfur binding subunit
VNYFNYKDPKKEQYLDWSDPDIEAATEGLKPGYANPDLKNKFGTEQRKIAGSNHVKGVIEKCTFCVQRVEKGQDPACVETCPVHALSFGDIENPRSPASKELNRRSRDTFRLLEDWNTKPSVFYFGNQPSPEAREIEKPKVRED